MGNWSKGVVAGVILSVMGLFALRSGFIDVRWPWERFPEFASVELDFELSDEARVAAVEPIALDCRARIHAVVPVEGVRRHRLFGQVYRTDGVRMEAVGDVDTCVEGSVVRVTHGEGGTTEVVVPGESIVFNRPRVRGQETAASVEVTKGAVGKLTDVFPWVDESSALVPQGYAYAQAVIGGSACMEAAYALTAETLIEGYRQQFVDQGLDPDRLRVRIEGQPSFAQNEAVEVAGDVEFSVAADAVRCTPAEGASSGPSQPSR